MSTPKPLISIVTPVLNGMPYLAACIESVLTQGYPNIEHVVIDGGSTDGSVELLSSYSARFPSRVRFVSEPDNGPGDGWSKGVRMTRGGVLGCIGADDRCEPGAIDAVVAFFREHPDSHFVHGGCRQVSDDGRVIHHVPGPFEYRAFLNSARDIATPSAYYRRDVLDRIGPLEECGDDFELMLRISREFPVHRIDATLSTLRFERGTAFNPLDAHDRAAAFRNSYLISRRHGGARLSRLAVRYYWASAAARLGVSPDSVLARSASRAARALRSLG
jgi:glycosyltransferase involved in cell wall biosynthesis